jgi:hypothetical protein
LSDPTDEILKLQGMPWLQRKAVSIGSLTLKIKHTKNDGIDSITIEQFLTGGIPGTKEERVLDWQPKAREDHVFGAVVGRSRRISVSDIDNSYLKMAWTADTSKDQAIETVIMSDTPKSGKTWVTRQVSQFS